jgi:hypothetical protein
MTKQSPLWAKVKEGNKEGVAEVDCIEVDLTLLVCNMSFHNFCGMTKMGFTDMKNKCGKARGNISRT